MKMVRLVGLQSVCNITIKIKYIKSAIASRLEDETGV